MKRAGVWIGTSGWAYKEWAGHFYPKGWPKKDEFKYYVRHFPTVEINATFYRLPTLKMVRGWREKSPVGFVFAVKGSRYLTHIRRLRDTSKGLRKYFSRLKPLANRAGPILWQLPPSFQKNDENFARLGRFLKKLPTAYRHAIEFRHPSWMDEQTMDLLRRHRAANVWISSLKMPADYAITGDFVYLRFHGLEGGAYHDYTRAELEPWAKHLAAAARQKLPAYVYFNNDLNTRAPLNAQALGRLLGRLAVAPKTGAAPIDDIAHPERKPATWPTWTRTKKSAPASTRRTRRRRRAKSEAGATDRRPQTRKSRATSAHAASARRRRGTSASSVSPPAAQTPGRLSSRRFAAAQFSASALPPAR